MKDMTQGSIVRHLLSMGASLAFGMLFQTLYFLVDLYFVAHLSGAAMAGVSAAGAAMFVVFSLTQVVGVGTFAAISHAVGRKDQTEAAFILNQALALAVLSGACILIGGYFLAPLYMRLIGADATTSQAGVTFLYWTMPGLASQFPLVALGSALRGTGNVRPPVVVQSVTVGLNIILAPVLIAGWGTHYPMGVAGAGLAAAISMVVAVLLLWIYMLARERYLSISVASWRPRLSTWKQLLEIGLPAGGEFLISFALVSVTYYCIRNFGSVAQAGAGVGARVTQAIYLPAMALAFAAGPVAGQNFGAGNAERVRASFRDAASLATIFMIAAMVIAQWLPRILVNPFTDDPAVRAFCTVFLGIMSWSFIAEGLTFTCSSLFQGLGYTKPILLIAATRLLTYAAPAIWLSSMVGFRIEQLWVLSVVSAVIQAAMSLVLLQMQFRRRLSPLQVTAAS